MLIAFTECDNSQLIITLDLSTSSGEMDQERGRGSSIEDTASE